MGPYKTPWLTDDVIKSSAFQSIFDMPSNQFTGLDSGYIAEARDNRPGPVVEGEDGEMYAQDSNYTLEGWETEQTGDTPLYYYANSQELGDVYEGNYFNRQEDGTISVQGRYQSEADIKSEWDADEGMGYFKEANPDLDFDTYLSFIKDTSNLVNQGLNRDEDPDPFNALADQYGINTSFQNDDGDMFEFNGSNFTKTFKTPNPEYGRMLVAAGAGAMLTPLATQFAAGALGSAGTTMGIAANTNPLLASAATTAGSAVPSALASGIGAGVSSAASQALVTGNVDPKAVLVNAVLGGVNPGQYVAENFVPQQAVTESLTFGGTSPSNFLNGFVEGSVNAGLTDLVQNGNIDLKSAGTSGLLEGLVNSFKDAKNDYEYYSPEAAEARYLIDNPTASVQEAKDYVANLIDNGLIEQATGQLLNKTNLGALIGEGGLLPFIPELDVAPIRDGLGMLANATDGIVNGVRIGDVLELPDGTRFSANSLSETERNNLINNQGAVVIGRQTMGLANNPVVNTLSAGLNKSKEAINTTATKISDFLSGDKDKAKAGKDVSEAESEQMTAYKNLLYETIDKKVDIENPDMDTRAKVAATMKPEEMKVFRDRAKAILAYTDANGDPFWHGKYGLDEKYNLNDNPRGDTEVKGTADNLDIQFNTGKDLYSVGADLRGTKRVPGKERPPGYNPLIFNLEDLDRVVLPDAGSVEDSILEQAIRDIYKSYTGVELSSDSETGDIVDASSQAVSVDQITNNTTIKPETVTTDNAEDPVVNTETVVPVDKDPVTNTTTQLPTTGGAPITLPEDAPDPRNPRSSDPVLWTDLEWRQNNLGYKGKGDRAKAYDKNMGMLKQAMANQALGVDFKLPKGLTDKELYEAGKLT
jgi:hypothetical protein